MHTGRADYAQCIRRLARGDFITIPGDLDRSLFALQLSNTYPERYLSAAAPGLDDNNLEELPAQLGQCRSLEVLHLTNNRRLATLPESIGALLHLHHILLDGTAVRSLPLSMSKCMKLEYIVADEHVLVDPPFNIWSLMDGAAIRNYLSNKAQEC